MKSLRATASGWFMLRDYEQQLAAFRAGEGGSFPLMVARPPDSSAVALLLAWVRAYADAATAEGLDTSDTAAKLSLELNLDSDDKYDGQQARALLKASKIAAAYVCSDCGHEQDSMDRHCDACNSVRVVAIAVLEQAIGPQWREAFE